MNKQTDKPVTKSSGVQVSDLPPKKDAKGGLLPAVAPQGANALSQKSLSHQTEQFHK